MNVIIVIGKRQRVKKKERREKSDREREDGKWKCEVIILQEANRLRDRIHFLWWWLWLLPLLRNDCYRDDDCDGLNWSVSFKNDLNILKYLVRWPKSNWCCLFQQWCSMQKKLVSKCSYKWKWGRTKYNWIFFRFLKFSDLRTISIHACLTNFRNLNQNFNETAYVNGKLVLRCFSFFFSSSVIVLLCVYRFMWERVFCCFQTTIFTSYEYFNATD